MQIAVAVGIAAAMTVLSAAGYGAVATMLGYAAVAIAAVAPPLGLALLILLVPLREPAGFGPLGFNLVLGIGVLLGCLAGLPRGRSELRVSLLWFFLGAFGILAMIQVLATPSDFLGAQSGYATLQLAALAGGGAILLAAQHLLRTRDWGPYLDLVVVSGNRGRRPRHRVDRNERSHPRDVPVAVRDRGRARQSRWPIQQHELLRTLRGHGVPGRAPSSVQRSSVATSSDLGGSGRDRGGGRPELFPRRPARWSRWDRRARVFAKQGTRGRRGPSVRDRCVRFVPSVFGGPLQRDCRGDLD